MQKKYNVSKTNVTLHQNNYLDKKQLTLIKSNDEAGKHSNPAKDARPFVRLIPIGRCFCPD
jgi:hypothetical protein